MANISNKMLQYFYKLAWKIDNLSAQQENCRSFAECSFYQTEKCISKRNTAMMIVRRKGTVFRSLAVFLFSIKTILLSKRTLEPGIAFIIHGSNIIFSLKFELIFSLAMILFLTWNPFHFHYILWRMKYIDVLSFRHVFLRADSSSRKTSSFPFY